MSKQLARKHTRSPLRPTGTQNEGSYRARDSRDGDNRAGDSLAYARPVGEQNGVSKVMWREIRGSIPSDIDYCLIWKVVWREIRGSIPSVVFKKEEHKTVKIERMQEIQEGSDQPWPPSDQPWPPSRVSLTSRTGTAGSGSIRERLGLKKEGLDRPFTTRDVLGDIDYCIIWKVWIDR